MWKYSVCHKFFDRAQSHVEADETNNNIDSIKELLKTLPKENKQLLLAIINIACLVSCHSSLNLMDSTNLGRIFGPYIYWQQYSVKSALFEIQTVNNLFTYLMDNITNFVDALY